MGTTSAWSDWHASAGLLNIVNACMQADLLTPDQTPTASPRTADERMSHAAVQQPSPLSRLTLPDFDAHDSHAAFLQELLSPTHAQPSTAVQSEEAVSDLDAVDELSGQCWHSCRFHHIPEIKVVCGLICVHAVGVAAMHANF